MKTPEQFRGGNEKPEVTDDQGELERLAEAADAARRAGVYDPSETEGEK
ncbi:MAG: hypothetical protein NUV60_02605 [Patescibacteria group bacterium]|nr:hypothetical protein [Patescibacteria group bacterium]